jgi:FkbM family methyltransferase
MSDLVGPSGRVLAIEAIPELAERLAVRVRDSGQKNVEVVPKAISCREGRSAFCFVKGDPAYSGLQQRLDLPSGLETSVTTIEVPVTTLDHLLANNRRRVRFVKMDLEGGGVSCGSRCGLITEKSLSAASFRTWGEKRRIVVWLYARRLVCPI